MHPSEPAQQWATTAAPLPGETGQDPAHPVALPQVSRAELVRATALTVLLAALAGSVSAALWAVVADPPYSLVTAGNAVMDGPQLAREFGVDVAFAWTCALLAVPFGIFVGWRWYRNRWPQAAVLAAAAGLAGLVAWQLGIHLGPPDPVGVLATASRGDRILEPLAVHARGLLLVYPCGALLGFIGAVAVADRRRATPAVRR